MGLLKLIKGAKEFTKIMKDEFKYCKDMDIGQYVERIKTNPGLYGQLETDQEELLNRIVEKYADYPSNKDEKTSCKDGCCGFDSEDPVSSLYSTLLGFGFSMRFSKGVSKYKSYKFVNKHVEDLEKELMYLESKGL